MGKSLTSKSFGNAAPEGLISPLSYQRTDGEAVDSLKQACPKALDMSNLPKDTAGFLPKGEE